MPARSKLALVAAAVLSCTLISSCGESNPSDNNPPPGDNTPPTILSVTPSEGATDANLIGRFQVAFSESLDPATLGNSAIQVASRNVSGYVEYDAATMTATFTPDTTYAANEDLELVVSSSVTDLAGNPLSGDRTTGFTTGPLDEEHIRDPFWPNQSIAEAQPIQNLRYYRTLSLWGDDRDIFEFTITDTYKVRASTPILYADHSPWLMKFLRADGAAYTRASWVGINSNNYGDMMYTFPPGTYYVCIGDTTVNEYVIYTLKLYTDPKCVDDPYEENDFIEEAAPLAPGTYTDMRCCYLDRDFYAIDVEAGQTLSVDLSWGWTAGGWFRLYDPSGMSLQDFSPGWQPMHLETVAAQTGTYYVSTRFTVEGEYDMTVTVE